MKRYLLTPVIILSLSACVQAPQSPMHIAARKAAGAELAAKQCSGFVGGYEGVKRLRQDANKNVNLARQLGATDEVIAESKSTVQTAFDLEEAFTSRPQACNSLVGNLAWAEG